MTESKRKTIQIQGNEKDELIDRVEAFAKKRGIATATAARILIRAELDREQERKK
jgi:hypothetical protein